MWFNSTDNQTTVVLPLKTEWVKLNDMYSGYYRVKYSTKLWNRLKDNIHVKIFTTSRNDNY